MYGEGDMTGTSDELIEGLGSLMNQANAQRLKHSERTAKLILRLGARMDLHEEEFVLLRQGMLMHDIGKTEIPEGLLNKRGPLTQEEWKVMKRHTEIGFRLVNRIPVPKPVAEMVLYHHENWDGTGYPEGLRGEAIPFYARLAAVVEVWDALTHVLPYRPAWKKEDAMNYLQDQSGLKFDPQIIPEFIRLVNSL
jgi:putative nucleotidyltransferase with HDIG domain